MKYELVWRRVVIATTYTPDRERAACRFRNYVEAVPHIKAEECKYRDADTRDRWYKL